MNIKKEACEQIINKPEAGMKHQGCCNLPVCPPYCEMHQFINRPQMDIDKVANEFYAFMSEAGLSRKLSLCDMRKIFNHFKENWRPS